MESSKLRHQHSILFQVSEDTRNELRKIIADGQQKRQDVFDEASVLAKSLMSTQKIIPAKEFDGKVPHGTDLVLTTIEFADSGMVQKKRNKGVSRNHSANGETQI